MKFWDSSALLPLLVAEPAGEQLRQLMAEDPRLLVWWSSRVEITSALARRERERALSARDMNAAMSALGNLAATWEEILPGDTVRAKAERLLRVHPLRAADSLQLAAAIVASGGETGTLPFVCLDARLADAARREGFTVIDPVADASSGSA